MSIFSKDTVVTGISHARRGRRRGERRGRHARIVNNQKGVEMNRGER